MSGPTCAKHNIEKIPMQGGKKKTWFVGCPKCQAEKAAGGAPPPAPPAPTAKPAAATSEPAKKKYRIEPGLFYSRKVEVSE